MSDIENYLNALSLAQRQLKKQQNAEERAKKKQADREIEKGMFLLGRAALGSISSEADIERLGRLALEDAKSDGARKVINQAVESIKLRIRSDASGESGSTGGGTSAPPAPANAGSGQPNPSPKRDPEAGAAQAAPIAGAQPR